MPAPGLDMSMKRAINIIIWTKLQEGQEEQEIGLVTPVNPKGPSTGEPPEPDPGMLPPGPKKIAGGSKPALNPGQRSGSIKAHLAGLQKKAAAKAAKKSGMKALKGGIEEALQISAGNRCPEADQAVPKIHGTFDQEAALSAVGTGNCR